MNPSKLLHIKLFRIAVAIVAATLLTCAGQLRALAQYSGQPIPKDVRITRNIPYVRGGTERQTLDVYANPKAKALLIWVHGGSWTQGDKKNPPILPLLSKGFSIASVNYRYVTTDPYPAQVQDVKAAIRYLRANATALGLVTQNIGLAGQSAGGHIVALVGTTSGAPGLDVGEYLTESSEVQAVVVMSGPTDLTLYRKSAPNDPLSLLIGGTVQDSQDKAKAASAVTYAKGTAPPFLLLYGERDPLVSPTHGENLERVLKAAGVPVTLQVFKAEHQLPARRVGPMVTAFFTKNLSD
ncbi:hypothetical protein DB346_24190 [Verrucomicrobia bacterium LW23]|nr:hypothetical protein DB346_24190 [Verrucomicrobia bacterium LW23]